MTETRRPTDSIRLATALELPLGELAYRLSAVLLEQDAQTRRDYIKINPTGKNVQLKVLREGDEFVYYGPDPDGSISTEQFIVALDMEGRIEKDPE